MGSLADYPNSNHIPLYLGNYDIVILKVLKGEETGGEGPRGGMGRDGVGWDGQEKVEQEKKKLGARGRR